MIRGWHYSRHGYSEGPVTDDELQRLAALGQLRPTDLVWAEPLAQWVPALASNWLLFGTTHRQPARSVMGAADVSGPSTDLPSGSNRLSALRRALAGLWQILAVRWYAASVPARSAGLICIATCFAVGCLGLAVLTRSPAAGSRPFAATSLFGTDESRSVVAFDRPPPDLGQIDYVRGPEGQPLETRSIPNAPMASEFQGYVSGGVFSRHGRLTDWYAGRRQKLGEQWYAFGKRQGHFQWWFHNGRKKGEMYYVNDRLDGPLREWYPDGTPQREAFLKGGEFHGPEIDYYPTGTKQKLAHWSAGRRKGSAIWWRSDGSRLREVEYENDSRQSERWFGTDGAVVDSPARAGLTVDQWYLFLKDSATRAGISLAWPRHEFAARVGGGASQGKWVVECSDGTLTVHGLDPGPSRPAAPFVSFGISFHRTGSLSSGRFGRTDLDRTISDLDEAWGRQNFESIIVPWDDLMSILGPPAEDRFIEPGKRMLTYRCRDGVRTFRVKQTFREQSEPNQAIIEREELR